MVPALISQSVFQFDRDSCPLPRSGHCVAADESNLYVIGGYVQYDDKLVVKGEIWRYNFLSGGWRKIHFVRSTFSLAASHAVYLMGHTLIIHGGTGTQFGEFIDNSLTVMDFKSLETYTLPSSYKNDVRDIPISTYGHTLTHVVLDGESFLYKVGGVMSTTYTMNVYRYSMLQKHWERVSHENDLNDWRPPPRYRHDTALHDRKLYIIAGGNADITHPLWPMPVFDLESHSWSKISFSGTRPGLLRYQSSAVVGTTVYVFGGILNDEAIGGDVYGLNLSTLTCFRVGGQELPTYFHSVTYVPQFQEIYCFGGNISMRPVTRTNQLQRFRLLQYPLELRELAWRHFSRSLHTASRLVSGLRTLLVASEKTPDSLNDLGTPDILKTISRIYDGILSVISEYALNSTDAKSLLPWDHFEISHAVDTAVKAATVTLLIQFGTGLGLISHHDAPKESVLDALITSLQTSPLRLSKFVEFFSTIQRMSTTEESTDGACRQKMPLLSWQLSADHLVDLFRGHIYEQRSVDLEQFCERTDLPLRGSFDEFFMTALLYGMRVPDRFIHRLPEGLRYLQFIHLVEAALLRIAPQPA
ncbi:unnamed protein product [Dicrocoelium dendriticum]|nr:unnamed protein product [Dicrocoelium dendriticum]